MMRWPLMWRKTHEKSLARLIEGRLNERQRLWRVAEEQTTLRILAQQRARAIQEHLNLLEAQK